MEYLRLVFIGQEVYSEWCNKPVEDKCPDDRCFAPCKYRVRKDK